MAQAQVDQLRKNYGLTPVMEELISNVRLSEATFLFEIEKLRARLGEAYLVVSQYQLAFPESFTCTVCGFLCFEESKGPKRLHSACPKECGGGVCVGCYEDGFQYNCCE
jgi:hypothetical protein